jgi:hypothetical protein
MSSESVCFSLDLLGKMLKLSANVGGILRQLANFRRGHAQEHDGVAHPLEQIAHANLPKVLLTPV